MTWQRLESTTIDGSLLEGEAACIADPLWLLGRQWQVGEFTGEDAASPLVVEATFSHASLSRVRLGSPDGGGPVADRLELPLEAAVEREAVTDGPAAPRLAAEAGLELRRELAAAGASRRPPRPPAGRVSAGTRSRRRAGPGRPGRARAARPPRARRALGARGPRDRRCRRGRAARAWPGCGRSSTPGATGTRPGAPSPRRARARGIRSAWSTASRSRRGSAGRTSSSSTPPSTRAAAWTGTPSTWPRTARRPWAPAASCRAATSGCCRRARDSPARRRHAGGSSRTPSVWFGDLGTAPEDLARVAVAGFGTLFGDDWYLVPCRLPTGSVVRADSVRVLDCFGEAHVIRSCAELDGPDRVWRFFELTGDDSADAAQLRDRECPWLLLAPSLAGVTQSPAIEEVALLRDEAANLGWAAELRIESPAGRTIDRAARARSAATPPAPAADDAWGYRLATPVPANLVPLVPVRSLADGALYLQRGRVEVAGGESTGALGRVLEPDSALLIVDAEVPATGARVTRSWQLARTTEGGVVLWVGRRKDPGPPRRSPGLRFDELTPST